MNPEKFMVPHRISSLLCLFSVGCSTLSGPENDPTRGEAPPAALQEAHEDRARQSEPDPGSPQPTVERPAMEKARGDKAPGKVPMIQALGTTGEGVKNQLANDQGLLGALASQSGADSGVGLSSGTLGLRGGGLGGGGAGYGAGGIGVLGTKGRAGKQDLRDPSSAEGYRNAGVNPSTLTVDDALSTFATDVDTGSFTLARRMLLEEQRLPDMDGVRVEEFINYPDWSYPTPTDDSPVGVNLEVAPSPWQGGHHLLRVGLRARDMRGDRDPANLVFLVDVSGSMSGPDRLPRAQAALHQLVDSLNGNDSVALVTYAGSTGVILEPTPADQKSKIHAAIDGLQSGGGTAMSSGVDLAYQLAQRSARPGRENRVIVLSDGDANIGRSTPEALLAQIHEYAGQGITLSTIGFGVGNYQDAMMEQFADKGDGNYYYVDSLAEAKRIFTENLAGTVQTVARDVKVQVEFNAAAVSSWRLIGYENRDVADRDFRNDKVDGGEMGSGQRVTVLYDLVLDRTPEGPLATVSFRAKRPGQDAAAREWRTTLDASKVHEDFASASVDFRAVVGMAGFAEILRHSPTAQGLTMNAVAGILEGARRAGREDGEVEKMVQRARALWG